MATETIRTTQFTAPDPSAGGLACSGTGTTGTCSINKNCRTTVLTVSSIRWKTWQSPAHQSDWTAVSLKVAWSLSALNAEACDGVARLTLSYSTNNGSSWTNFSGFPKNATGSSQNGTASASIPASVNLAQLLVRAVLEVQVDSSESCAGLPPGDPLPCFTVLTGSVSDVFLQATYPQGACCVGSNCTTTTPSQCSGTFKGDGTTCGSSTCLDTRPCCKPDGNCALLTQSACSAAGGTWYANKTLCSQVNCSASGCCVRANGTCVTTTQSNCNGAGDSWLGAGSSCTVAPDDHDCVTCTNVGACCKSDGTCVRSTECWCTHAGGAFRGVGTTCSPSPCSSRRFVLV